MTSCPQTCPSETTNPKDFKLFGVHDKPATKDLFSECPYSSSEKCNHYLQYGLSYLSCEYRTDRKYPMKDQSTAEAFCKKIMPEGTYMGVTNMYFRQDGHAHNGIFCNFNIY